MISGVVGVASGRWLRAAVLAALVPSPVASAREAGGEQEVADVLMRHVARLEAGESDATEMIDAALELVDDDDARLRLARRLSRHLDAAQPRGRGAAAAWTLGRLADRGPRPARERSELRLFAARRLRDTLQRAPDLDARLAAASALGVLEDGAASPLLADLLSDPRLPPAAEPVLLLALAGTGGAEASLLEGLLWRGGGPEWADVVTSTFLRRGRLAWPEVADALRRAAEPTVRAVSATLLLLLAEPEAACALTEAYGHEPTPTLRRVVLQALAAGRSPLARDFLEHVAREEQVADLRQAAASLLALFEPPPTVNARAGRVADVLRAAARRAVRSHDLTLVEGAARPEHVALIEAVLRRLPLREDATWLRDHARLAQVRAGLVVESAAAGAPGPS